MPATSSRRFFRHYLQCNPQIKAEIQLQAHGPQHQQRWIATILTDTLSVHIRSQEHTSISQAKDEACSRYLWSIGYSFDPIDEPLSQVDAATAKSTTTPSPSVSSISAQPFLQAEPEPSTSNFNSTPNVSVDKPLEINECLPVPLTPQQTCLLPEPPSQHGLVYTELSSLITSALSSSSDPGSAISFDSAQAATTTMRSFDTIPQMLRHSHTYRMQLLKIASSHPHAINSERIKIALTNDEVHLGQCLKELLMSPEQKQVVLGMSGRDAEAFLQVLHSAIAKGILSGPDQTFSRMAYRLLVKLSDVSNEIPPHIKISGTSSLGGHALFGGSNSDVYHGEYQGIPVGVKRIRTFQGDLQNRASSQRIGKEALVWHTLQHPNVLAFLGIDCDIFPGFVCLISPWMKNGTIMQFVAEHGMIDIGARIIELASGLAYLHSQNVIHGDLRGGNILIDLDWHVQIADFGLTLLCDQTRGNSSDVGGSLRWMAPELHCPSACNLPHSRRTPATDIYAFGCTCLEIYTQEVPFGELKEGDVILKVVLGRRPVKPTPDILPHSLWSIIEACWAQEVSQRPTASSVLHLLGCISL